MSQQPPPDPDQRLNIDDASIRDSQVGQAGRDLTQINVRVFGFPNLAYFVDGLLRRQAPSSSKPSIKQEFRYRKILLNRVKKSWIEGVLKKSLHVKALIELGLEERLDLIDDPFSGVQELPDETRKMLPPGTNIPQVFKEMGEGRTLLILGEPGLGKTTILLKLTQNLIAQTKADLSQPIPVVFNLPSWARGRQSIADWLVQELSSKYQVSPALGKAWIEDQQLLLLLDGLDEVKAEQRGACVDALNQFIQTHGQTEIVVCSRIRDYEALSTRLQLQGAIYIQSLTPEQINQYLERAGDQLAAVKTLLQTDTVLQELAQSPLTLSIMSLAYQGVSVEELPRTGSIEECRQHLFDAYIKRMFLHEKTGKPREYDPRYSSALTVRWLTWLAQRMCQESQTIFLIERMQPTWLQNQAQRRLYRFGNGLIGGLIGALIVGLKGGLSSGLVGALIGGLIGGLIEEIKTVEPFRFPWIKAKSGLIYGLIGALIVGLIDGLINGLINGLIGGLSVGLVFGLIGGLSDALEIENRTFPNQGIWRSVVKAGILWLLFGLPNGLIYGLIYGLSVGLLFGLLFGGGACIQHFALRLILYRNGFIPWNYARFLDYATERIFLQKVGGGYIFVHRLLLEHFAQLKVEN